MSTLTPGSSSGVRKMGLRIFLTLLGINALMGIAVVLGGDMGEAGGRVLGTSLLLTGGVVLGLACATGQRSRALGPVWPIGVVAAALGTTLWIVGIWSTDQGDALWQSAGTLLVVAAAIACASLLSLATLPAGSRWMMWTAYGVLALLALFATIGIWGGGSDGGLWQITGVLSIALAALAIALPVLHHAGARGTRTHGADLSPVAFCPHCGTPVTANVDQATRCGRCATVFRVHVETSSASSAPTGQ